jgi:aminodeoxyfutalosine deaminase
MDVPVVCDITGIPFRGGFLEIFAASHLLPVASPAVEGGAIAVENGRIVAVGTAAELRRSFGGDVRDFPGCVIIPGLVNAHTHLELTHFPSWLLRKGVGYSPRTYEDWAVQLVKIRRSVSADEMAHSVREGLRISLESGTTFIGEINSTRDVLPLFTESPLSGLVFLELIGQDPTAFAPLLERSAKAASELRGNFTGGLSPHTPFTLSEECLALSAAAARTAGARKAIHVAEPPSEAEFLFSSTGPLAEILFTFARWEEFIPSPRKTTSVAYLDSLGLLDERTAAVHCVHVTPSDVEILAERRTAVILCPRSNEKLDVGKAPLPLFRKAGLRLGLGTDSLASNDSLSMFDEMGFLLDSFPHLSPQEALSIATAGGADVLGAEGRGSLQVGMIADFLVVEPGSGGDLLERIVRDSRLHEVRIGGKSVL